MLRCDVVGHLQRRSRVMLGPRLNFGYVVPERPPESVVRIPHRSNSIGKTVERETR